MNSEGNINEDLITLLIKCQILSMVNLFMFIYNDNNRHCRLSNILLMRNEGNISQAMRYS
jgi:hypothetical protein